MVVGRLPIKYRYLLLYDCKTKYSEMMNSNITYVIQIHAAYYNVGEALESNQILVTRRYVICLRYRMPELCSYLTKYKIFYLQAKCYFFNDLYKKNF